MAEKINNRVFEFYMLNLFYGYLPASFLGLATAMLGMVPYVLRWLLLIVCLFLGVRSIRNSWFSKNASDKSFDYYDHPTPTIYDILKLGLRNVGILCVTCAATYVPMKFLAAVNILTTSSWIYGICIYTIWVFLFQLQNIFTTFYQASNDKIYIRHGPMSFSLITHGIKSASIIKRKDITLDKRLRTRFLFIVGIRSFDNYVIVELEMKNQIDNALFLDVYLTPEDPLGFWKYIQEKIRLRA